MSWEEIVRLHIAIGSLLFIFRTSHSQLWIISIGAWGATKLKEVIDLLSMLLVLLLLVRCSASASGIVASKLRIATLWSVRADHARTFTCFFLLFCDIAQLIAFHILSVSSTVLNNEIIGRVRQIPSR